MSSYSVVYKHREVIGTKEIEEHLKAMPLPINGSGNTITQKVFQIKFFLKIKSLKKKLPNYPPPPPPLLSSF